jgi:hypothetical protein
MLYCARMKIQFTGWVFEGIMIKLGKGVAHESGN